MALDFPASPTNGQVFSSSGVAWTFDGDKWKVSSSSIQIVDGGNFTSGFSLANVTSDINGGSFD